MKKWLRNMENPNDTRAYDEIKKEFEQFNPDKSIASFAMELSDKCEW